MAKTKIRPNPILSERIKLARVSHEPKITQAALAEMIGVTDQTIRKYESGNYGVPKMAVKQIAKALGCCVEFLQGETLCFSEVDYSKEKIERNELIELGAKYVDEVSRQWRITEEFFKTFLDYDVKNTHKLENDGSITPVIRIIDQSGKEYCFESRLDIEDFLLKFFDDAKKMLRYHLLDYEEVKRRE